MTRTKRFGRWVNRLNASAFIALYIVVIVSVQAVFMLCEAELGQIGWLKTSHPFDWSELPPTVLAALLLACWALYDRDRALAKLKKNKHNASGN